jgi:hypothetical protein
VADVDYSQGLPTLGEVDYSQGLPSLGVDPGTSVAAARPDEAMGYVLSAVLSGSIAGFSVSRRDGWKQGVTIGLLVFFGVTSVKMFVDIWRRP